MIGKTTLKNYEFKTIEDYFDFILDSEINGQRSQVKNLYNKLSRDQKKQFYNYIQQFSKDYFDFSIVL